ncbi:LysM peptidoglycan-binding domain-containing protein [Nakamurella endophytica]|nr:LysM peptidoglycan-binding domain-containing protein [Nakamurella endophytica]
MVPRTEAGRRAVRRRARAVARTRPAIALVPLLGLPRAVRSADGGVGRAPAQRTPRWLRLTATAVVALSLTVVVVRLCDSGSAPTHVRSIHVERGDTLWSIATDAQPGTDPRPVIEDIRRINRLTGDDIRAGQVLEVPVAAAA